ncbi:hypothetical protein JXC34_01905 [Candidatus Woesearchaeota archaeon]|nr:hypothetical protein [Candidatus Woesearchaeota archaeon]
MAVLVDIVSELYPGLPLVYIDMFNLVWGSGDYLGYSVAKAALITFEQSNLRLYDLSIGIPVDSFPVVHDPDQKKPDHFLVWLSYDSKSERGLPYNQKTKKGDVVGFEELPVAVTTADKEHKKFIELYDRILSIVSKTRLLFPHLLSFDPCLYEISEKPTKSYFIDESTRRSRVTQISFVSLRPNNTPGRGSAVSVEVLKKKGRIEELVGGFTRAVNSRGELGRYRTRNYGPAFLDRIYEELLLPIESIYADPQTILKDS